MNRYKPYLTAFAVGAIVYTALEIVWRGYSHWSMSVTGGLCFATMYRMRVKRHKKHRIPFCIKGGLLITLAELSVGCIVNLLLGWNVWDYSHKKYNILGQVCISYSFLWILLSLPAGMLCDNICGYFSESNSKTRQTGRPTTLK